MTIPNAAPMGYRNGFSHLALQRGDHHRQLKSYGVSTRDPLPQLEHRQSGILTTAPRTHTGRRDNENGGCSASIPLRLPSLCADTAWSLTLRVI